MLAAAIATFALLLVPGTLTGMAAGLRPMPAAAAAGPVILGIGGYGAWLAGELGIRWGWWPLLALWALTTAIAYLVRRFLPVAAGPREDAGPGDHGPGGGAGPGASGSAGPGAGGGAGPGVVGDAVGGAGPGARGRLRPTAAEWATAAVAAAVSVVGSVRYLLPLNDLPDGGSNLRQAWDLQWHDNFLRWIADEGIASPTRAGELMNRETMREMFYPAAWHALAGLVPGDPVLQANVFGAVAPMVLLPAGAAMLAWTVAGRTHAPAAAMAAAVASFALPEITAALMVTGSLPYLLAVAAIPATMALLIRGRTVAAVPALLGVFLAHPAASVALAVFTLVWWLTSPRAGHLARLLALGAILGALLWPILGVVAGSGESVAEYHGQIDIGRAQSVWWTITGQSNHTTQFGWYPPLFALTVIGVLVLLLRRRPWTPWPVFALVVLGVVSDSAQLRWASPFGDWFKVLGTFFYDMSYRLQAPMGILRLVCIGVAVAWLAHAVEVGVAKLRPAREPAHPGRTRATAAAMVTAAVACVALVPVSWASGDDARASMLASRGTTFVSAADREAMEWLARQPRAMEGNILVNPSEGSGWMYALYDLPSLFMHFPWPDPKSKLSKKALDDLDLAGMGQPGDPSADSDVDVALRELDIRYVFISPPSAGSAGGAALASRSWARWSPGLTPVYRDGPTVIYAVDDMLSDAELRSVVRGSPKPPAAPDPATTPLRQPIIAPPSETVSPLAGAVIGVRAGTDGAGLPGAAGRLDGDPATAEALAAAVAAELRRRGAVVEELDDDAANGTGGTDGTAAPTIGAASYDAVVDVGMDGMAPSESGTRVSGRYPGTTGNDARATADLAAGIRDALVLQRFGPANRYDEQGRPAGAIDGLEPLWRTPPTTQSPEVIVSAGNSANAGERAGMATRKWRERFAVAVADGIAAMLRQQ